MAPESGIEDAALGAPEIAAQLTADPASFDFFQAVRVLERLYPGRARVGEFGDPAGEVAHFSANPSVAFPACEIQDVELSADGPATVRVNFMGLIGPLGVLPYHYTLLVAERQRARDRALQSFLDIFQHRMISLFYRAWEKHRLTVGYQRNQRDRITEHLLDLVGLGLPACRDQMSVPDETFIFHSGALAPQPRSAEALQHLLEDFFDVPVEIEQFVGGWYALPGGTQCSMGRDAGGASDQIGLGVVVGDEIWDQQSRVKIRLGPLSRAQYDRFLPTGPAYKILQELTRFFSHDQVEFDVQLVLARKEVPTCRLGEGGEQAASLGWGTWLRTAPLARDADETLLRL